MSWILALTDYLVAQSEGTKGTNLFIGTMPANSAQVVVLTQYSGDVVETQASGIQLHKPSLQVRVRGVPENYETPLAKITSIQTKLSTITNQTLSGIVFLRVRPITSIISLGQDSDLCFEFTCNFEVIYA